MGFLFLFYIFLSPAAGLLLNFCCVFNSVCLIGTHSCTLELELSFTKAKIDSDNTIKLQGNPMLAVVIVYYAI